MRQIFDRDRNLLRKHNCILSWFILHASSNLKLCDFAFFVVQITSHENKKSLSRLRTSNCQKITVIRQEHALV